MQCQVRVFDLALVFVTDAHAPFAPAPRDALTDTVDPLRVVQSVPKSDDCYSQYQINVGRTKRRWPHSRFAGHIDIVRIRSVVFSGVGSLFVSTPSGYSS